MNACLKIIPAWRWTIAFLFVCALAGAIEAQIQPQSTPILQLNHPLSGTLKARESFTYQLHLPANTFARVLVMQKGLNVFVRAFDFQKKRLAHANDSFGRNGPQLLQFVAETDGEYLIEVTALENELGGVYDIEFLGARTATGEDHTRVAANNLVAEANSLRAKAQDERNRQALPLFDKAIALYKKIDDKTGQKIFRKF